MLIVSRLAIASSLPLVITTSVGTAQEPPTLTFKCALTESARTSDARGRSEKLNYRTYNELYRFSSSAFQIWSGSEKRWSVNFCMPTSPDREVEFVCRQDDSGMLAQWPDSAVETIHNGVGRWASLALSLGYQYTLKINAAGGVDARIVKRTTTSQVTYFSKDADGSHRYAARADGVRETWAGYNLTVSAVGSCVRVG